MAVIGKINIDIHCEKCGVKQYPDALFCHRCGEKLKKPTYCTVCRRTDKNEAVFCEKCGTLLNRLDD